MCLTTIKCDNRDKPTILQNIKNKVDIVYSSDNNYIKYVKIKNLDQYGIFMYYPVAQKNLIDIPNAYFIAISCTFANWTMDKIYKAIYLSPLIYHDKFIQKPRYANKLRDIFLKNLNALIQDVYVNIKHIISVLNTYIELNSDVLYYTDTTLLKTFQSIKTRITEQYLGRAKKTDMQIIQLCLEEMISLQSFLSMNCLTVPSDKHTSFFQDFSIKSQDAKTININEVLHDLQISGIQVNERQCNNEYMFLEYFIQEPTSNDPISVEILSAYIQESDEKFVKLSDMLNSVIFSYDMDYIYFFQNSVLLTIVKLVLRKTIMIFEEEESTEDINHIVSQTNTNITNIVSMYHTMLPANFTESFTILNNVCNSSEAKTIKIQNLRNHYYSLTSIHFENEFHSANNTIHSILELLNNEFNNFNCFHLTYNIVRGQQDRYYLPLVTEKVPLLPNYDDIRANCCFVVDIYSLSYQARMYYNDTTSKYSLITIPKEILQIAFSIFSSIKIYMIKLINEKPSENSDLLKMAYNIAIILVNIPKVFKISIKVFEIRRIIDVVFAELNKYGIKYCLPPNFNYLLFNNIDFNNFGNREHIQLTMKSFFKNYEFDHVEFDKMNKDMYTFLDVQYLYESYIKNSFTIKKYQLHILTFWNGQLSTFVNIFTDLTVFTLNPSRLYAFYDIYFKFFIAVVYYEVIEILNKKSIQDIHTGFKAITNSNLLTNFSCTNFPQVLCPLVTNMDNILRLPSKYVYKDLHINEMSLRNELEAYRLKFMSKFMTFNIVIKGPESKINKIKYSFKHMIKSIVPGDTINGINHEISTSVASINKHFSRLHYRPDSKTKPIRTTYRSTYTNPEPKLFNG